jgi:hypothetical protein
VNILSTPKMGQQRILGKMMLVRLYQLVLLLDLDLPLKSMLWVSRCLLLLDAFPMTIHFPNSEFCAESYGQLNIATLPLLCTFSHRQNNLKHQLWTPTKVNLLGTKESFV